MAYNKHNFQPGDVLLASQLNEMDDQIEENERLASEIRKSVSEQAREIRLLNLAVDGVLMTEETNSEEAYTKQLPGNVLGVCLESMGGKSVVRNQLIKAPSESGYIASGATSALEDGVVSVYPSQSTWGGVITGYNIKSLLGHKYLVRADVKSLSADTIVTVATGGIRPIHNIAVTGSTAFETFSSIFTASQDYDVQWNIANRNGSGPFAFRNLVFIDLTQWFGSNIANTITTPEQAYALGVPCEPLPYDPGTTVSADVESVEVKNTSGVLTASYAIPEAIRSLPGYGETGALVDFANKEYTAPDGTKTDISDLIPEGTLAWLHTEPGGSITFRQPELEIPIPNTETYIVKTGGSL